MRVIFCRQALKTKQHQNKIKPTFGQWLTEATKLTALSLTLIGVSFLFQQTAQAETARIDDIIIDRQPDETYDSLIQRAETAATAALSQGFNRGSQITDVSVIILGENQGVIAPVLAIGLSRPQWNKGRDDFTYFNSARSLLRLDEQQLAADSPQPQGNTPPSPPEQQPNNPPGSARETINSPTTQPVNPPPGATSPPSGATPPGATSPGATPSPSGTPLPGSPALVPRPQAPGVAPITSPGDNFNATPPPVTPVTAPTGDTLPQVDPGNSTPNQL